MYLGMIICSLLLFWMSLAAILITQRQLLASFNFFACLVQLVDLAPPFFRWAAPPFECPDATISVTWFFFGLHLFSIYLTPKLYWRLRSLLVQRLNHNGASISVIQILDYVRLIYRYLTSNTAWRFENLLNRLAIFSAEFILGQNYDQTLHSKKEKFFPGPKIYGTNIFFLCLHFFVLFFVLERMSRQLFFLSWS